MVKAYRPDTLSEALALMAGGNKMIVAGGTDVLVRYRPRGGELPNLPCSAVFIGHLRELQKITRDDAAVHIGAAAVYSDILKHPDVPEAVKRPLRDIGSPSIRNLGTVGGNLCNASPAGDSLPMLYALGAKLHLQSKDGYREVKIGEFIWEPGKTILAPDEILTDIVIPNPDYNRLYFRKVGQRSANTISKLSLYAAARVSGGDIEAVRIVFGAVSPVLQRHREAEKVIAEAGTKQLPEVRDRILSLYSELITPIDDVRSDKEYRKETALRLLSDFLEKELAV